VSHWRGKQLFGILEKKLAAQAEQGLSIDRARPIVVLGAGPCGLRAAIELASLGAHVILAEKREEFTRIQRLKLWDCVAQDLVSWGVRAIAANATSFGADPDYLHVGCGELQVWLLKLCCFLGVDLRLGVEAKLLEWHCRCPLVEIGTEKIEAHAVVAADGSQSRTVAALQMPQVAQRSSQALGVVIHFKNTQSTEERNLRQYSWARQFNAPLFESLQVATGADLENIVYYKGENVHYIVMTPTKKCLLDTGVLKADLAKDFLSSSNLDRSELSRFARRVGRYQGIPDSSELLDKASNIFDFSETKRSESASVGRVFLVGDALLEPFWPEGLGIVRGFLTVFDASTAISYLNGDEAGERKAAALVQETYNVLKGLNLKSGPNVLLPAKGHRTHPKTRYRAFC
jgi:2-polyprenyl-6-methoxyphenol hydroxylase-like FAD-dependent oxidoreductase